MNEAAPDRDAGNGLLKTPFLPMRLFRRAAKQISIPLAHSGCPPHRTPGPVFARSIGRGLGYEHGK